MAQEEKYIRFDWAMKRLLRNKANYAVLEGLLTTLLGEKITINHLLESESNQEDEYDKYNRVDMLAEDSHGQLVIIEIQNNTEYAYFQRMLFGVSKLITEYINRGNGYEKIRKIYSVNIVYFDLGNGKDYVYHGTTEFRGIHNGDILNLSPFQMERFKATTVSQLYPEYYILKVNDFNRVAKTPLEEWIYYLHTGIIPDDANAPGLDQARKQLQLRRMSRDELNAYYRHLDNIVILRDNVNTSREEGRWEGLAEGRAKGRAEGRAEGMAEGRAEGMAEEKARALEEKKAMVRNLKASGVDLKIIASASGLPIDEIEKL